jgi:LSD1 subclass zinc finger protein
MSIKLETINCGNCGAPLQIPETAQFVTCNHCKTSLAVKRMDSITLTEKLDQTNERLDETEKRLAEMVYRNELSEETRRWERQRDSLMVKDKHGNKSKPSGIAGGFALLVTIIMAVVGSNAIGGFAFLFIIFGLFVFVVSLKKQQEFEAAQRRHKLRRQEITDRYVQARDNNSHSDYLKQLETAPTPQEFLRELEHS